LGEKVYPFIPGRSRTSIFSPSGACNHDVVDVPWCLLRINQVRGTLRFLPDLWGREGLTPSLNPKGWEAMPFINFSKDEIQCKIVYYGAGFCGKTTNLQYIFGHTQDDIRGKMVSIDTKGDRTLFFDFLSLNLGKIRGFDIRVQLYTVPGQVHYDATRKLVLKGVDGVVFVADSLKVQRKKNIESLINLAKNLAEKGISIRTIPLVLQYNKRDLDGTDSEILPIEMLEISTPCASSFLFSQCVEGRIYETCGN
jgi:signal recognition particle receptor subunit beta